LYLDIGGIEQYLQIRGENKDNPVILVLHGGPGSPMSYYSYYWQTDLEEDFTVVQWDQRGCGRTYYANEIQGMKDPTTELLISDLNEIVDYLTNRFNQDNVIILGHSWGTVLGARYTQLHPEKVSTYISVGQTVDSVKGDILSVEQAVLLAKNAEDETTANEILKAYEDVISGSLDMKELITLRTLTSRYLPSGENMSALQQIWMDLVMLIELFLINSLKMMVLISMIIQMNTR
ncbi:MAG: alpha/beta hydrolase, partial [Clostridiales bacterium]|nr:alpha/beta hydrolase [Clostridiales bacterium]